MSSEVPSARAVPDRGRVDESRAIRVGVAAAARRDGDRPIVIGPPEPSPVGGPGPATLLADGVVLDATFKPLGRGRAIMIGVGPGAEARHVLLGSVLASSGGPAGVEIVIDGWQVMLELESERQAALRERARRGHEAAGHGGPIMIRAIIPGRISAISVMPGESVAAGQQILVVEAMKMQNELRAPREGTIERIGVQVGQTIEVGDLLAVMD